MATPTDTRDPSAPVDVFAVPPPRVNRPLGITEVIDFGIELVRFRVGRLMIAGTAVIVPVTALVAVAVAVIASAMDDVAAYEDQGAAVLALTLLASVGPFVVYGLAALATGVYGVVVGAAVAAWHDGRDPTVRELLGALLRRIPALMVAKLISVAIVGAVMSICPVGWPLVNPLVMCISPVLGAERVGPFAAVSRSFRLAGNAFKHSVGLSASSTILTLALQLAVVSGPSLIASFIIGDGAEVGGLAVLAVAAVSVAVVLMGVVLVPLLSAGIATAMYLNLEVRTRGADLEAERRRLLP